MSKLLKQLASVRYAALSGLEFEEAIYGTRSLDGACKTPWLAHPTLKYYHPWPTWPTAAGAQNRRVFVAYLKWQDHTKAKADLGRVVGLVELQLSPSNAQEIWLPYVSVDPLFPRKGIAKQLLTQMCEYLKVETRTLVRSTASDEGAEKIQGFIDGLLDSMGIAWRQPNRRLAA
jgi:GNAT superfamily N-acetyltransferase